MRSTFSFVVGITLMLTATQSLAGNLSLETNGTSWLFGGWSLGLAATPLPHVALTVAHVADEKFPEPLVDVLKAENKGKGISWDFERANIASIDVYKEKDHKGLYLGVWTFFVENNRIEKDGEAATFDSTITYLRFGYRWFPGENDRFYVSPWAGIGKEYGVDGDTEVGGETWEPINNGLIATFNAGVVLF